MKKRSDIFLLLFLAFVFLATSICTSQVPQGKKEISSLQNEMPKLLSLSQQIALRESWLQKRHGLLLNMMRKHGIDMWIVVNEEFHDDPLTQHVAPPLPYASGRDIFIFMDTGEKGLRKVALLGFWEEHARRFFETDWPKDPRPADKVLSELFTTYQPNKIGLGLGGSRGVQRSLTHDSYLFLSEKMGPEATKRFVSAASLIEEYLDTRIPEELEQYTNLVRLTDVLTRRAFSNEVITPGKTTIGEVRRWLYDQVAANGCGLWFEPDLRIYEKGVEPKLYLGFPAVAEESAVIERGQLLHIDFGIIYMGFHSDWQKNAYVLRKDEKDVPEGFKKAMANTNLLQDVLARASRPGLTAGDVSEKVIVEMEKKGIEAKVYSHPIGNQGHGLGTGIGFGFRPGSKREPSKMTKLLRNGSYLSMELNTVTPVPEWGGKNAIIAMEDDVYLTDEGYKFFVPRQEKYYLIY